MDFLRIIGKYLSLIISLFILLFGGGMVLCGGVSFVSTFSGWGFLGIFGALIFLGIGISIFRYEWTILRNTWESHKTDTATPGEKTSIPQDGGDPI